MIVNEISLVIENRIFYGTLEAPWGERGELFLSLSLFGLCGKRVKKVLGRSLFFAPLCSLNPLWKNGLFFNCILFSFFNCIFLICCLYLFHISLKGSLSLMVFPLLSISPANSIQPLLHSLKSSPVSFHFILSFVSILFLCSFPFLAILF